MSGGYTRTVFMDSNLNGLYLVEHIFTLKMSCQAWEWHVCVKKVAPGFSNREFKSSEHHLKSSTTNKLAEMSTRLIKMQQPVRLLIRCLMSLLPDLSSWRLSSDTPLKEAPQSHSSSHYPKVMTMGEGRTINQLVNREIHLQALLILHQWTPVHHQHNIITLRPTGCQSLRSTLYPQFNNSPRLKVNRSSC